MRMPQGLRKLDDRVLGRSSKDEDGAHDDHRDDHDDHRDEREHRGEDGHHVKAAERSERTTRREADSPASSGGGDGLSSVLAVVWRVSSLVFVALGLVLVAAVVFILLPANEDNVIVRNALSLADQVSGPFRDVFSVDDPDRMRIYNYGLAAVVAFVLSGVVGKLPTGSKRRG
jgi:hypothetical protein